MEKHAAKVIMEPIAYIYNDFSSKFGIPRQSRLVEKITGRIVFAHNYRNPDALRGLEGYSHIWLLWEFSENIRENWSATVRPPRLGSNTRMGVFATRSPFRPNPIGLSVVKLDKIQLESPDGPLLFVSGADLMNGTPIFDIKPYLPHVDSIPEAMGGFAVKVAGKHLDVNCPDELLQYLPEGKRAVLREILAQDPRPGYQNDPKRIYGIEFAGFDVKFTVTENKLTVIKISKLL
ncbi:MAG: tRNA (N6-threonylcarbamoyladenosine(37)-N6)-methyltransferase TrmO [Acidaminococcaceae bacterium]|nr:tRNA (N6-threonylcarbamoyladenosine(37)-N6)-methyltransferase TrmO [Acidaminococcaceae bacterium]MCI2109889.1 tRNA (N6-threonylcarbamoyladenosine(37)-N6)-methyltransferase TrmO [Acidaminococcaceae bacterium]